MLWERATGAPVAPAIVWQDRRTADRCRELPAELIRARTGLVPDPYFSATKLEWLLARADAPPSGLAFGTVDSWLVWKLTGGAVHVTDRDERLADAAARLETLDWDDELLALFGVDRGLLPESCRRRASSARPRCSARRCRSPGIAGDQQAALFGQGCLAPGEAKATYGTGASSSSTPATTPRRAARAPATTAAARRERAYALEGAILVERRRRPVAARRARPDRRRGRERGARAIGRRRRAASYFVPALTGLGSPYWDAGRARPDLRAHPRDDRARTSSAPRSRRSRYQVADVVDALPAPVAVCAPTAGRARTAFLMQFQADLLGCPVEVAAERETTALGAAALAAGSAPRVAVGATFEPAMTADEAGARRADWAAALARARRRNRFCNRFL